MTAQPHIDPDGPWTLGVKIGVPFTALALLLVLAGVALLVLFWLAEEGFLTLIWTVPVSLAALTIAFGGALWAYWPLDSSYHQYRAVSGTVDQISSRLIGNDEGGSDQKFVVRFRGSSQPFAVNDTRASLLHRGDQLTISCKRSFEYGSEDGYDCKWGRP